ncbi:MAG: ABC transporter substrate-binding protein [Chloroflexota bacterium]
MIGKKGIVIVGLLSVLGLLLSSCAPAAAPTPTAKPAAPAPAKAPPAAPTAKPAAPAATKAPAAAPTVKPAAPAPTAKPAAPAPTPKPAAEQPKSGGILWVSHPGDPRSYDPIQESSLDSIALIVPNYSGIVQHDPLEPTKVIGDLAEKWEMSPDGLSYTFHFYKNVKWHDGSALSSEDARFSMETVREPPKGITSTRKEWLKAVDKITAPDKDTLKMTLSYPSASFLHNMADGRMVVAPKHVFEAKGNWRRDIVGTGPYKFKSFTSGTSFEVVKNNDYFIKGRPYLDGITWYIVSDVATRFAALRTHRVHVTPHNAYGLRPTESELVRKEMADKIESQKVRSLIFYAFWMPFNKPPWNDARVRRAVDMAIDRSKAIKVAMEGVGDGGCFMPPGDWSLPQSELEKVPGYREAKDADIAAAKKLLAEAGFAQGLQTTTVTRNAPQFEKAMVALKEQLAPIGIDITISLKDLPTLTDLLFRRSFDTAYFSGSSSFDDPDLVFGQNFVTGVTRNFSDFSDEKFDKWYDEQSRMLDMAKRKQVVLDMQRRLFELVPCSVIYWGVFEQGMWKEVKGLGRHVGVYNNLKFQNVWLDR